MLKRDCIAITAIIFCSCILLIDNGACEDQNTGTIEIIKGDKAAEIIRAAKAAEIAKAAEEEKTKPAVNVNNSICPVSEDNIIAAEAVKYEYNGNIYNFCCESCVQHFKKYPDKFVHRLTKL